MNDIVKPFFVSSFLASSIFVVSQWGLNLSVMAAESSNDRYLAKDKLVQSPGRTTYGIDPEKGDDANPVGKPWKTFGKLNAMRLAAGDKVVIYPGIQEETFKPSGEGTAEKPIVIQFLPGVHTIAVMSPVRDLLIQRNRFVGCGITIQANIKAKKSEAPVHENIRILDNSFEGDGPISAECVKGLEVRGNTSGKSALKVSTDPSCSEVKVEN